MTVPSCLVFHPHQMVQLCPALSPAGPKEGPGSRNPVPLAGHQQGTVQFTMGKPSPAQSLPHLASLVSVPRGLSAGLALLHPGLSLESRGCYGKRMHKWANACHLDRPWLAFVHIAFCWLLFLLLLFFFKLTNGFPGSS